MAYTLNSINLGIVRKEKHTKDAQLFQQPMPGYDSSSAVVLDIFGVQRTININGTFIDGYGSVAIATFIGYLEDFAAGNQSAVVYHSDRNPGQAGTGNFNVLVNRVSWEVSEGEATSVSFDIELIEGST